MSLHIYLDMVGCRLNQSEIESMANQLRQAGHKIVSTPDEAEIVIVNTCCVTARAAADSRKMIRHHARLSAGKIIVTGCWSTLNIQEALDLPKVTAVVTNVEKQNLINEFIPDNLIHQSSRSRLVRIPVPGIRHRTRAFIKVQDGCNDHCTFCITRIARGPAKSILPMKIFEDIQAAVDGGCKEIVLTGVQIGSFGKDLRPAITLAKLVEKIIEEYPYIRISISSIEPWDLDDKLIEQWQKPNVNRHIHIPIQSGSDFILRRMARRTSVAELHQLIEKLKTRIPGVCLTTDMIVGFPGETEHDYLASMELVKDLRLSGGHVFTFSPMPGTPASRYPDHVNPSLSKKRNRQMRELFKECSMEFMNANLQQEAMVLWEETKNLDGNWTLLGYTDNYIKVKTYSSVNLYNTISKIYLSNMDENEGLLLGKIID